MFDSLQHMKRPVHCAEQPMQWNMVLRHPCLIVATSTYIAASNLWGANHNGTTTFTFGSRNTLKRPYNKQRNRSHPWKAKPNIATNWTCHEKSHYRLVTKSHERHLQWGMHRPCCEHDSNMSDHAIAKLNPSIGKASSPPLRNVFV